MVEELVKVCPECRSEYLPHIEVCPYCECALEYPGAAPPPAPEPTIETPEGVLPPGLDYACVRVADLDWARRLGARLAEAGIDHRIDADEQSGSCCSGRPSRFGVFVRKSDVPGATQIDDTQYREMVPDEAAYGVSCGEAADQCPACGEPLSDGAVECVSCGLVFGGGVAMCTACGAPVPPEAETCPACGAAFAR